MVLIHPLVGSKQSQRLDKPSSQQPQIIHIKLLLECWSDGLFFLHDTKSMRHRRTILLAVTTVYTHRLVQILLIVKCLSYTQNLFIINREIHWISISVHWRMVIPEVQITADVCALHLRPTRFQFHVCTLALWAVCLWSITAPAIQLCSKYAWLLFFIGAQRNNSSSLFFYTEII